MHLTKWGHACVSLTRPGLRLVIDPGVLTEPEALDGADAVLITHEHPDHFAEDRLRAAAEADPALRIWTNRSVAALLDGLGTRVKAVGDGDAFDIDGVGVQVRGEWHRPIHPDVPDVPNIGFLVDGTLFHPGDAFTVPDTPVDTLLVPVHGPWSSTGEVVDYLREVGPRRALTIHDGQLNQAGNHVVDTVLGATLAGSATDYTRLAPGEQTALAPVAAAKAVGSTS